MRSRGLAYMVGPLFLVIALSGCLSDGGGQLDADDNDVTQVSGSVAAVPTLESCEYKFDADYAQVCAPGPIADVHPVEVIYDPSDLDGSLIQIAVWRPVVDEGVKVPVIVDAGPYYSGDIETNYGGHIMRLGENFLSHGYAVAAVTVRGTADHGGCMDLMGPKERHDLNQAITYLGEAEWSNGAVAMIGASYDGSTPFEVASMGNPYLKTIVPVSGLTDIYDLMYRNGTTEFRGPLVLNALYYSFTLTTGERSTEHQLIGLVCPETWEGLEASVWAGAGLGHDATGWWADRDSRPGLDSNWEGSMLFVHGLQDWNVDPALNIPYVQQLADRKGVTVHQWLGQWGHAFPDSACDAGEDDYRCRWDYAEYLLKWFDYYLKGIDTIDLGAAVQVQDFDGAWRTSDSWPPADRTFEELELSGDSKIVALGQAVPGNIRLQPNPNSGLVGRPIPDMRTTLPMQAYATFEGQVLEEDMVISGLPKVHITVNPSTPAGNMGATLLRKDADGTVSEIGWTSINLNFADGTNDFAPVVPGQDLEVKMEIQPMEAKLPAGSQLQVLVWASTDHDRTTNAPSGTIDLILGDLASVVKVPTVDAASLNYFEVPFPVIEEEAEPAGDGTE